MRWDWDWEYTPSPLNPLMESIRADRIIAISTAIVVIIIYNAKTSATLQFPAHPPPSPPPPPSTLQRLFLSPQFMTLAAAPNIS